MVKSIVIAICLILSIIIASVSLAQSGPQTTSPEEPAIQMSPVRIDDMVLFHVRGIKAFPAEERAGAIEERIRKIAADPAVKIDLLTSVESGMSTDLVADGRPIMSIFDVDASYGRSSEADTGKGIYYQASDIHRKIPPGPE